MSAVPAKLTGYCLRCGGDCFDDARHRCRPKLAHVDEIIALKTSVAKVKASFDRRPVWPPSKQALYDELRAAIEGMDIALKRYG